MEEYNRLTTMSLITQSPTLKALCESCGEDGCDACCEVYQDNYCVGCPVQEAFQRLWDYESSGLSPEEVKNARTALELSKAIKVVIENDTEFTCPTCGKTTEDYDVTTLKVCPECGQKLQW